MIKQAFHYYMVTEHYAGLQFSRYGKTYYITRLDNVRGSAGYETYTYVLWHQDLTTAAVYNPALTYRLFSEKWYPWVTL